MKVGRAKFNYGNYLWSYKEQFLIKQNHVIFIKALIKCSLLDVLIDINALIILWLH